MREGFQLKNTCGASGRTNEERSDLLRRFALVIEQVNRRSEYAVRDFSPVRHFLLKTAEK